MSKTDIINEPSHYKDESGIECIEITRHMTFCEGNCFKYLYRAGRKDCTILDLNKAIKYAEECKKEEQSLFGIDVCRNIEIVSSHRCSNIKKAMLALSCGLYDDVILFVSKKIERLNNAQE